MPLFMCDGCWEEIPLLKARIHCTVCQSVDLCANCHVVGRAVDGHTKRHKMVVVERSGIDTSGDGVTSQGTSTVTPSINSTWPMNAASPPYSTTQSPMSQPQPMTSSPAQSSQHSTPAVAPRVYAHPMSMQTPEALSAFAPSDVVTGWQPLFNGTQATQMMIDLLTAIFLCLDDAGIRVLSPEQYCAFLDAQGYFENENIWKRNFSPRYGYNPDDIADYELRTAYENFSIDHVLQIRSSSLNMTGPFDIALSPMSNGLMPMLSLRGFIDITVVEVLGEPNIGWQRLNNVKNAYGVWPELGDIPRSMLPAVASAEIVDSVTQIGIMAQQRATERAEARRLGMPDGMFGTQDLPVQLDAYGRPMQYQ